MKTVFPPILSPEERHNLLSRIFRLSGRPRDKGHKEKNKEAINTAWKESSLKDLPIETFRSILFTHPHPNGHTKIKKENKMSNKIVDSENQKLSFKELVKYVIKECGYIPDDKVWRAIAEGLGFVKENWWVVKNKLENTEGYVFTSIPNGYKVEIVNLHKEEIEGIKRDLKRLGDLLRQLENS